MKTLTIITMYLLLMGCTHSSNAAMPKKILMLISTGFYAPEYFKPRAIFEKSGFEVFVAAKYNSPVLPDKRQQGTHPSVDPDLVFKNVKVSDYDAIVFAGGNGAWEDFFPNKDVHKILTDGFKQNKTVALLCSATGLLGVANNLDGKSEPIARNKNVTGYKRVVGLLTELGQVNYHPGESGKPFVMVDGNLITGRDPGSSELFAETVKNALR
jgi:putative intracellular protease/amidase